MTSTEVSSALHARSVAINQHMNTQAQLSVIFRSSAQYHWSYSLLYESPKVQATLTEGTQAVPVPFHKAFCFPCTRPSLPRHESHLKNEHLSFGGKAPAQYSQLSHIK